MVILKGCTMIPIFACSLTADKSESRTRFVKYEASQGGRVKSAIGVCIMTLWRFCPVLHTHLPLVSG